MTEPNEALLREETVTVEQNDTGLSPLELCTLVLGALIATKHDKAIRVTPQAINAFINLNAGEIQVARDTRDGSLIVSLADVPAEG